MTDISLANGRVLPVFPQIALDEIEGGADRILRTVGLDFKDDPTSLEMLETLGARIDGSRARLDGERLREVIRANAPASFTWHGQGRDAALHCGGGDAIFAPVYGPPKVTRPDGSSRLGCLEDYREIVALCSQTPALQSTGFLVCNVHDVEKGDRHLEMAKAHLELSDKPFMGTIFGEKALAEVIDLAGGGEPEPGHCTLLHLINSTPPLVFQKNPLRCLRAASSLGEGCIVTSYMMMGATAPVTLMGAMTQGYAEVLAGLALTQLYRPGAPVVMGLYAVPFSMSTMQPVFGDPVSNLSQIAGIQLARRLGVPCRGDGGVTSSKVDDAQAGYESLAATQAAYFGGADFILHAAGWLENGRCTHLGKMQRDIEGLEALQAGADLGSTLQLS